MANRLYIGARYVPVPFNNPDGSYNWLPGIAYEGLTIVIYDHRSYISKKPVPAISTPPSEDTDHWVDAYLFNADVAEALLSIEELQETKADKDGVYASLWAGELISKDRQTDNAPYLLRETGGDLKRIAPLAYPTLVGASVAENQLCNGESVTVPNGHKYYSKINGTETLGASTGTAIAINDSAKDMVTDMTQKLGSAIADYIYSLGSTNGISKLREWGFLKGYQAYNAGSIESVEVTGKVVRGFNQWNEVWELGYYQDNGTPATSTNRIRSKNRIKVLPATAYYLNASINNYELYVLFYDANNTFISKALIRNAVFRTPRNAENILFFIVGQTTYNHDICINLSSDRNGEYEPYTTTSYPLGSDVLRGIFKLDANNKLYADGDRKESDGTITRKYKKIVIDENSDIRTGSYNMPFRIIIPDKKRLTGTTAEPNGITNKLIGVTQASPWGIEYTFSFTNNTDDMFFKLSDSITTIEDAKTYIASNPITVVYELATPTTEQSTPFTSPQIVYPDGTEEFITENGVPVGHETKYPYDLVGLVENLINIPDVPSTNGTYKLQAVRTSSGVTYDWVTD